MANARVADHSRPTPSQNTSASKRGPLRRLLDAIEQSNMQRAEREIAQYLSGRGGRFTDEAEREIERRFLTHR